jgi:hypothetical protein
MVIRNLLFVAQELAVWLRLFQSERCAWRRTVVATYGLMWLVAVQFQPLFRGICLYADLQSLR